ncbi:aminotransferase class I/II-fold pyridoxal phosphate-dependent enzyme [Flavobacterium stagni]|uniref:8-amino-7-oxononanoate synthase n=1 Tax=Flavobacterium stagni TaxID=2506421 RepID=A0A4V1N325_9FLAO|nr:8-amino-7-oxononanoate synthase [Flavobacterium stagni]RXR24520.1 8-amino-7-oxononanoate synthase [Flavobacterium stagni]
MKFPENLQHKLFQRQAANALRQLPVYGNRLDFASNDYLGFAQNAALFEAVHDFLISRNSKTNGATGSRLISGNHSLYSETEAAIAQFHQAESALIFNSGYDANVGFFSAVPQRGDVILYDELCHASIRDGLQMSKAKSYKFNHNDPEELQQSLEKWNSKRTAENHFEIYVALETVYSMDGDTPPLEEIVLLCEQYNAYLVVDEAHALGVMGEHGEGVVQYLNLQSRIFARIVTFGKGLGCHGAAILGSHELQSYLVNFARSFIYTTGLSPHAVATIHVAYQFLQQEQATVQALQTRIVHMNQEIKRLGLQPLFVYSKSAIHCAIIPGNDKVRAIAHSLQEAGFEVKPILSPTVPEGQERLRFCLHAFTPLQSITAVLERLASTLFQ